MAVDDRGERNRPIYAGVGAPADAEDLTYLGELATTLGTRRTGSSAERQALGAEWMFDGLEWFETDTEIEYRVKGGLWKLVSQDTGWLPLPNKSDNFRADNGAAYRLKNGFLCYRGQLTKLANGQPANLGPTDGLFTMPSGLRPEVIKYADLTANPGDPVRARILNTGRAELAHPNPPAINFVILDSITPYPPS